MYKVGDVVKLKKTGNPILDGTICIITGLPFDQYSDQHILLGDFRKVQSKNITMTITHHCFERETDEVSIRNAKRWFTETLARIL